MRHYYDEQEDNNLDIETGEIMEHSVSRTGGFYYLGSLLGVILISVALFFTLQDIPEFIQKGDALNSAIFVVLSVFLITWDKYMMTILVSEIREKKKDKEAIKNGTMAKPKLTPGNFLAKFTIIIWLIFFGFMLTGLLLQTIFDYHIPENIILKVAGSLAALFITGCLSMIIEYAIGIIKMLIRSSHEDEE